MFVDYKQLESWLHEKLRPLCMADPVPLSQYVIALIKKDKAEKELRDICVDQLEVFLQDSTISFVDALFTTLNDRSYISSTVAHEELQNKIAVEPKVSEGVPVTQKDKKRPIPIESTETSDSKRRRGDSSHRKTKPYSQSSGSRSPAKLVNSSDSGTQKSVRKNDDADVCQKSLVHPKNKSDRVNSRNDRDDLDFRRSKQREEESVIRRERSTRDRSEHDRRGTKDHNSGDRNSVLGTKRRCRDFEERGFCALGSQCPCDHGPDALVLPSAQAAAAAITRLTPVSHSNGNESSSSSSLTHAARIPSIVSVVASDTSRIQSTSTIESLYRPTSTSHTDIGLNQMEEASSSANLLMTDPIATIQLINKGNRGILGPTPIRRNVVPIPMVSIPESSITGDVRAPPAYEPDKPQISVLAASSSPNGDITWPKSTTEPHLTYTPSPITDGAAVAAVATSDSAFPCQLYVTRLPWRLNNDFKLTEHFSKFGTLTRVVSRYMGLPDTALLEYSTPDEAERTFRSPEPILANRFIRLSTSLQNRPMGRFRRGRQTPYDVRPKTLSERLGCRQIDTSRNYDWLRSTVVETDYNYETHPDQPKGGRSRWRLERNAAGGYAADAGSDDEDVDNDRTREQDDPDVYRTTSNDKGFSYRATGNDSYGEQYEGAIKTSLPKSHFKFSISYKDKEETAAYLWQKQKNLALKQREEQLKLLDKSKEAKQTLLEAQKQRVVRLQAQLKTVMSQLENLVKTGAIGSSQNETEGKPVDRSQLLAEAKRLQQELENALAVEKKLVVGKTPVEPTPVGSTATSAAALQSLPEPLATARMKQITEVRAALKQVEQDMASLKAKGEPVVEICRRVLELKRRLVHLETIRPSDFTDPLNGDASDPSGMFPSRTQTKLDKRPRTLFISGLAPADVNPFQRALAMNYLHTQRVVKHAEPVTNLPILEVTFCTRDFAEAALRQFHQFHGNPLTMSFEAPPLAEPTGPTETIQQHSSVVSSTQSETPMESDSFESNNRSTFHSNHSSPTSTTIPIQE